jgi:hypothetical protein
MDFESPIASEPLDSGKVAIKIIERYAGKVGHDMVSVPTHSFTQHQNRGFSYTDRGMMNRDFSYGDRG